MKLLVTRSIQAALDAEIDADSMVCRETRRARCACDCGLRPLPTRLGAIELLAPKWHRTELFGRFAEIEGPVLLVITRMALAGEATRPTALELTGLVCGRQFESASLTRLIRTLNFELAGFLRRQLEMEYPGLSESHRQRLSMSGCGEA